MQADYLLLLSLTISAIRNTLWEKPDSFVVLTVLKHQGRVSVRQDLGNHQLQRLQGSVHLCPALPDSGHQLSSCPSEPSSAFLQQLIDAPGSWGVSPRLPIRHCLKLQGTPRAHLPVRSAEELQSRLVRSVRGFLLRSAPVSGQGGETCVSPGWGPCVGAKTAQIYFKWRRKPLRFPQTLKL